MYEFIDKFTEKTDCTVTNSLCFNLGIKWLKIKTKIASFTSGRENFQGDIHVTAGLWECLHILQTFELFEFIAFVL